MSRPLPRYDTLPWYRQFWPWFLILLPASVVVGGLSMLYVANRHADDLVIDDYYKNGLAINRELEKKQHALAQGISVRLTFADGTVTATVQGPVDNQDLRLLLSHPFEADQDFSVILQRITAGRYRGTLVHNIAARWHWTLQETQATTWRLDGSVPSADIKRANGS